MDVYAFPDIGVPNYPPVGPQLDRCIVYSIVRTESGFDQRDMSSAKAVGLMQVTPAAGRDTAKRFGVTYDWKRLVSDPAYNTQMGAAEISALLKVACTSFRFKPTIREVASLARPVQDTVSLISTADRSRSPGCSRTLAA